VRYARKLPLQALFCALAVFACELISLPFTTMNVCDDGPYIRMAHTFANTGHIVYNGWSASMMAAQLYLAAVFIKLFGFSTTSVRMSTLLLAVVTAFVFHRTLVRIGSSERNATLGTLAVVISPMYLMLSATFMTDIGGLFAITLCLYGCIRATRASADRSAIAWVFFAVFTCAAFGTSRQIAWLGDLVMVPSTLWLLRSRSRVLLAGTVATAVGFVFILGCMHWLGNQPYAVPVPLLVRPFPKRVALLQLSYIVLEIPFLVLPVIAVFTPRIFRSRPYIRSLLLTVLLAYIIIAFYSRNAPDPILRFEPTAGFVGSWINVYGVYAGIPLPSVVLHMKTLIVLTAICIGGLLGVIAVALQARGARSSPRAATDDLSWKQLGFLLLPFSVAYLMLLAATAGTTHYIFDRYAIGLLGPTMIVLIRLYQERVQPSLPFASVLLIIVMGAYGIIVTHNTFALDRARVDLANELHAQGVPFTSIDGGWDYNLGTELQNSNHINFPLIKVPANAYVIPRSAPPAYCHGFWLDFTPHVHPVYATSFFPDDCYGRAPFAPVQYRPWPLGRPINLYAVRYAPPAG
jgi:hypothetical protein